jgi:hypothetical protein
MPYVDPKMLDQTIPYKLNDKSDIYCLGFLLWELTIRSSPFNGLEDNHIAFKVLGEHEPEPNTNGIFTGLYQSMCKIIWSYYYYNFYFSFRNLIFNLFE